MKWSKNIFKAYCVNLIVTTYFDESDKEEVDHLKVRFDNDAEQ